MLAELAEYIESLPPDVPETRIVIQFLNSMNCLFENGLLCHEPIVNGDSPVLDRMGKGFLFLCKWLDSLLEQGTFLFHSY